MREDSEMADIQVDEILPDMLGAASEVFGERWTDIKEYAEEELEKLAKTLSEIGQLRVSRQISEGEASVLLEMQKNTARTVMLTLEGMGLIMVEEAINAALSIISEVINGALGFQLV